MEDADAERWAPRTSGTAGWMLPAIVVFLFVASLLAVYPW
jgi:hypothetical protein